ncbi:MAG: RNA polymerase sigma factor [Lachnospiraceae bacterium]|nr:RNA polymerase sigma factor [Ruminococcus sp.]MCM1275234.1 RNA polymerase sigma factor [Lachnospiraceae bacterium]
MDDAQIVELYFERSERALAETAAKYGRLCEGVAYRILGSREDAEECVNDAYLNVWNSVPPKRPDNFRAFICKITRNLSLTRVKYYAAKKRTPESLVSFSELEGTLSDQAPFFEDDGEELGRAMSDFLRTQSADARNVFMRRYWFLETIEDISKRYSFSQSKVKSLLFRTRERLKKYLEKEGIEI